MHTGICNEDVKIFWTFGACSLQFYINLTELDGHLGIRPEDGFLTLYCVSFYFAVHTDRMNTTYCFNLRT